MAPRSAGVAYPIEHQTNAPVIYVLASGNVSRPIPALDAPSSTTITSPGHRKFCIAFQYASWVRGSSEGTKGTFIDGRAGCFVVTVLEDASTRNCKSSAI